MSGDALIVLINDILDLAKVDAGKMSLKKHL
jgi:signal transduction histidine kinase